MHKKHTTTDAEIYYNVEGEGFPVVLLHGFGEDSNIWNKQLALLKNHSKLIIADLPGSGLSTIAAGLNNEPSAIEFYADCIYNLLVAEKINKCIMLGHSMGGYITLCFAEKYQAMIKGFGL